MMLNRLRKTIIFIIFIFALNFGVSLADTIAPTVAFDRFPYDFTTNNQPILTGIASDEISPIVSIECRVNGGNWSAATPIDGTFNSQQEKFSWMTPQPLPFALTTNRAEVRAYDAAGNVTNPPASYDFYAVGKEPVFTVKSHSSLLVNGDNISHNPRFEITILSADPPVTVRRSIQEASQAEEELGDLIVTSDPSNPYLFYSRYEPILSNGIYKLKIEVTDSQGDNDVLEINQLKVMDNALLILAKTPLCYPNPFNPDQPPYNVSISFVLPRPADITFSLYDLNLNLIVKKLFFANQIGGNAGYNEILWNGADAGGRKVGNGIYIFLLQGENILVGKGKITILR